jgi:hypothetical protein
VAVTELPFHDGHESAATLTGAKGRKGCVRHDWERRTAANPDVELPDRCLRCGAVKATSRRSKNNATRGKAIQRKRIEGLGGRNLSGNNENLDGIGTMFAYESKSGGSFSERYWRWIKGIPTRGDQVPVLIVTDAPGPGHRARSIVVVDYDSWRDLHGEG